MCLDLFLCPPLGLLQIMLCLNKVKHEKTKSKVRLETGPQNNIQND